MDRTQTSTRAGRHWIGQWDPEDPVFWAETGQQVARRSLLASVFAEHLGFSVWSLWSVLVLFMVPASGFSLDPGQKFLLASLVTLAGALLRIPCTLAVPRFGGRNWTIFSALALLLPAAAAAVAMRQPGLPLWALLLAAVTAGLGGGNFSSSMANINAFFPERLKGRALGLNAGGGNIGVAVIQLAGLLGTFGSFIGYSFAFGVVLQTQFGRTPLGAAELTFTGPLLGSLARPAGGGVGNGATFKMIPEIFAARARQAGNGAAAMAQARRVSSAMPGIVGAVGALGGVLINLAFRASFTSAAKSAGPALIAFLVFYAVCFAVTYAVYAEGGASAQQAAAPNHRGSRLSRSR